jgi:protocatechuate 3,4-dioxygenase beta subunit
LGIWLVPGPLTSRASAAGAGGAIHGTVMGVNGQPAADVKVKLVPHARRHEPHAAAQTATTDASGHFVFVGVTPGEYVIQAGGKGRGHGRTTTSVGPDQTVNISVGLRGRGHVRVRRK